MKRLHLFLKLIFLGLEGMKKLYQSQQGLKQSGKGIEKGQISFLLKD